VHRVNRRRDSRLPSVSFRSNASDNVNPSEDFTAKRKSSIVCVLRPNDLCYDRPGTRRSSKDVSHLADAYIRPLITSTTRCSWAPAAFLSLSLSPAPFHFESEIALSAGSLEGAMLSTLPQSQRSIPTASSFFLRVDVARRLRFKSPTLLLI
jgi:hypothetical protein